MGYLWFAYKEGSDVLTFFSVNIHHNTPKKPCLKFSIRWNVDRFTKNVFFFGRFLDFHIKLMFSDTTASIDKIELNHLAWMITKGI